MPRAAPATRKPAGKPAGKPAAKGGRAGALLPPGLRPRAAWAGFAGAVSGARRDLADGAAARAVAVAALYPLDAAKARVQVSGVGGRAARAAGRVVARGVKGWGGVGAAVVGQVGFGVVGFGVFEVVRRALDGGWRGSEGWGKERRVVVAACVADLVGSLWLAPCEVVKCKVQAGVHGGVGSAVRAIWQGGGPAAFYQGFVAQALRDMPFRAAQLVLYARARDLYLRRVKKPAAAAAAAVSKAEAAAIGAAVGAAVGAATTPLDVVKTRLMAQRAGAGSSYAGWLGCVGGSVRREGAGALFRGAKVRTLYMAASVALFSVAYEASRTYIADRKLLWHADVARGDAR